MTDTQIFTICISIAIPLGLLLYSNTRISEAKETLRSEMNLGWERMMARFDKIDARMDRMETALLDRMANIEVRLQHLEER